MVLVAEYVSLFSSGAVVSAGVVSVSVVVVSVSVVVVVSLVVVSSIGRLTNLSFCESCLCLSNCENFIII